MTEKKYSFLNINTKWRVEVTNGRRGREGIAQRVDVME
jgi:hypothetical protein